MAILTTEQIAKINQEALSTWDTPIDFDQPVVDATIQALEDCYNTQCRSLLHTAIQNSSTPKTFTTAEKTEYECAYLKFKCDELKASSGTTRIR